MLDPDRDLRFVPVAGDPTAYLSFLCVQHCACVFLKSALFCILLRLKLFNFVPGLRSTRDWREGDVVLGWCVPRKKQGKCGR